MQDPRQAQDQRPDTEMQNVRRRPRNQAEQREDVGRIRRGEVLDPAVEGCVPEFDRYEQNLVQREEYGNLDEYRETARSRVDLLLLVERHQLLVHLRLVVAIALAKTHHFRLELLQDRKSTRLNSSH